MLKSSCTMRFIYLKNIHAEALFRNVHTRLNLRSNKTRKVPALVGFTVYIDYGTGKCTIMI